MKRCLKCIFFAILAIWTVGFCSWEHRPKSPDKAWVKIDKKTGRGYYKYTQKMYALPDVDVEWVVRSMNNDIDGYTVWVSPYKAPDSIMINLKYE